MNTSEDLYVFTGADFDAIADAVEFSVANAPVHSVIQTTRQAVYSALLENSRRLVKPEPVRTVVQEPTLKKYQMGRGTPHRYGDIVWVEIPDHEFDVEEVWTRLSPLIHTDSPRAFETFRRAIATDHRFERLDRPGFWFRFSSK